MKVLFIEDDRMNRRVVKDMMDVVGAEFFEADDGESGLRMFGDSHFDVLLLDLRMPGMDGFEVMRRVRARDDAKAEVPIIILTADTAPNLRERCIEAGADEVLFKPVAMDALFDAMGRAMAKRPGGAVFH